MQVYTFHRYSGRPRTYLRHNHCRVCTYALSVCTICSFALGDKGGEVQHVTSRELVAWRRGLFLKEGQIEVLSCVFSFFDAGGSVCECMCVYTHTHTHSTWGARCEPRGRDETLGGPEISRWTKYWQYVFVYLHKVHIISVHIYAGRRDEIWSNCFIL